jgi:rod shape determining protein RodA
MYQSKPVSKGMDWLVVFLYAMLVIIGIMCIFMVEYKESSNWLTTFFNGKTNYSKQLMFAGICVLLATFIMLSDSKLYTAFANLFYLFGILLMFATFVIGKDVKGSKSWIALGGGFNLQPAELCKIFTSLALAKYISLQDTDFTKTKSQIIATAIALFPALLSRLQHETGLALVYLCFFIPMYREGLPGRVLVIGFSFAVLVIATIIVDNKVLLAIIILIIAIGFGYFLWKKLRRNITLLFGLIFLLLVVESIPLFVVPYIFNNALECYQSTRVLSAFGKEYDCSQNKHNKVEAAAGKSSFKPDDYNVKQSKIAIGSGGFLGKGFLKGTQTRGKYVPEQHTDFIFTSLGEAFGFVGSLIFLGIYLLLLFRIIKMAERQRSTFSRVYAYCVASIMFFHIMVNVSMTIGLFPIIGIALPLMSYGGSSLVTFTVLIFILVRLDADRQMVLR